jgi:hypothetical protein
MRHNSKHACPLEQQRRETPAEAEYADAKALRERERQKQDVIDLEWDPDQGVQWEAQQLLDSQIIIERFRGGTAAARLANYH